ncbi:MAG: hypothetical protein Q4C95_06300 [Planctomycetia bacterium]|nr:hypothetical protein [Planctomycetia bacterium]
MEIINRRSFLKTLLLGGTACCFSCLAVDNGFSLEVLNYESLYASLYPKTDQEEAFLKDIVEKIDKKAIPVKIVVASYRYAMKKRKSERIVYFAKSLSILCDRAGIKVKFLPLK